MEPNNQNQNGSRRPLPPEGRPTYEDFHAEGIDIVANSGISETNEFSMGETNSAAETALSELGKQEAMNDSVPQKPLTPEQAAKIGNLQEISAAETPVPKKPQEFPIQDPVPPQPKISSLIPPQSPTGLPKSPEMKNNPSIKQLRTFKSDAEEAVRYQNISAVDIALAEQKKRDSSTPIEYVHDEASHTNLGIFILVVMAIIVALLGGWYYWFSSSQPAQIESSVSKDNIQSFIPHKTSSSLVLDAKENAIILIGARLADAAGTSSVFALLPKATAESREGVPLSDIFRDTEMPESLLRSLSGEYMIGSFRSSRNDPFLILKSSSFPITFAGMLEWEGEMAKDLLPLLKVAHDETELATTTRPFEDSVVQNVDIRVVRSQAGEIILAYAFPSKDTVVITTGESSLRHILSELLKVRTIQ